MGSNRLLGRSWSHADQSLFKFNRMVRAMYSSQTITDPPASESRSSIQMAAETSSTAISFNASSHTHRKSFVRWIETKGQQYRSTGNTSSTNYLDGRSHPFPLNPQFQPQPPLSQNVKGRIYDDWQSGTGLRQLSQSYGISLERIEAILKLEQVSQKWNSEVSLSISVRTTSI